MDNITNINLGTCPLQYLSIGYVGETGARPVKFDFSAWATEYGAGVLQLLLQRPGDANPYPVLLDIDGTTAVWTPDATATEKTGQGQAQLVYAVGGVIVKNAIFRVLIAPSLGAAGDPPEPYEDWLERLLTIAAEAQQSAIDAAGSAEAAGTSAGAAAGSAGAAAQSALDAEAAKTAAETAEQTAQQATTLARAKAAQASEAAQIAGREADYAQQQNIAAGYSAESAHDDADLAAQSAEDAQAAASAAQTAATAAGAAAADAAAAVTEVETKGAEQITAINQAGTTQIAAVDAAGAAQEQAIEDKGEEVLESIPEDYSELSSDVVDLKSEISSYEVVTDEIINGAASFNESIYYGGYANNLFLFDIHKTRDYAVKKIKLYVLKSNIANPTYAFKLFSWYISGTQLLVREVSEQVSLEAPTDARELRTVTLNNPFTISAGDGIGIIATPYKWMGYNSNTSESVAPVLFRDANYDTIDSGYRIYSYIPTFSQQQPAVTLYSSGVEMKEFVPKTDYPKIVTALNSDNVEWELGTIGDDGALTDSTRYLRTKNYLHLAAGTHMWCGQYYTFAVFSYADDLSFVSHTGQITEYTIVTTGFYKLTIYPADVFDSTAYIPTNSVLSFSSVQSYSNDICDAINYNNTQNTPIRVSGTNAKMAHDSSIVFDGNDLWAAYYEDDTTYGEALTNLTTFIVIKKLNPYTRQEVSTQTFKVGDSIGAYTQSGRAPYIPKLVVYNDYILMYFLGWDAVGEELEICSCRIDKSTLALSNFAVCTLEDEDGVEHNMTCSGISAVYKSYTNIDYLPEIIGITAQPQYYGGYWYSTLNSVFGNSPGMKTLFIKSSNGLDWTVNRVFTEIGVAQECSFVIKDDYVYAATRAGCYLAKYSIDQEVTGCVKIFQPLSIPLKTAMCIFRGKILLACNIKCERDSMISDNRKNMAIFEIDENLNTILKTRIITEQGMHYPCFAIANDELWFAWSNDYRFLNRMTQRTNVSVSKLEV